MHIHAHIHMNMYIYVHINIYIHTYTYMYICTTNKIYTYEQKNLCYICLHTYVYIYTHMRTVTNCMKHIKCERADLHHTLWLQIGRGDLRWKFCILKIALFISGSRHKLHPTTTKIPPWVTGGPLGQQWPSLWHSCAQARARRRRGRHKDTEKVRETQGMSALWTL